MPKFRQTKYLGKGQLIKPMMPVHKLLLNGGENYWPSQQLSFFRGNAFVYFVSKRRGCGWNVGKVQLKLEVQVRVVHDDASAIFSLYCV